MNIRELEDEFYSKKLYHSYSSLSKLLYSPSLFYREYVLKQREPSTGKHLIEGKLVHSLLLDRANFDELFVIAPSGIPSDNTLKVIQHVWNHHKAEEGSDDKTLSDYTDVIIDKLSEMELHQSLKTDEQRVAKIITDTSNEYWEFLKKAEDRDIIDIDMLNKCSEYQEAIKNNHEAMNLLTLGDDIVNEHGLVADLNEYGFEIGIKGLLDNLTVDHYNQVIRINDIKTTGKTIAEFAESVEYWKYWLQMGIYHLLVRSNLKDLAYRYKIVHNFIVIDIYKQVYCFEVSTNSIDLWVDQTITALANANWHYTNRDYSLPYNFLKEKVYL